MHTRFRTTIRDLAALAAGAALTVAAAVTVTAALTFAASPGAQAQQRSFPAGTRLGMLEITVFPRALLDGREVTMAPGARILDPSNLIRLSGSVRGEHAVRYRTDFLGQVVEVWLLTPDEHERARAEAAAGGARR